LHELISQSYPKNYLSQQFLKQPFMSVINCLTRKIISVTGNIKIKVMYIFGKAI